MQDPWLLGAATVLLALAMAVSLSEALAPAGVGGPAWW